MGLGTQCVGVNSGRSTSTASKFDVPHRKARRDCLRFQNSSIKVPQSEMKMAKNPISGTSDQACTTDTVSGLPFTSRRCSCMTVAALNSDPAWPMFWSITAC
jgi:hypothetical protein